MRYLVLFFLFTSSTTSLIVEFPNGNVETFGHVHASFGAQELTLNNEKQSIKLRIPRPSHGCELFEKKERNNEEENSNQCIDKVGIYHETVLLIERGYCNFTDKILWAQKLGAAGVIVADNEPRGLIYWGVIMSSESSEINEMIKIPSVFISFESGRFLRNTIDTLCHDDDDTNCQDMLKVFMNATGNELSFEQAYTWSLELALVWFTMGGMSLFLSTGLWYLCALVMGAYDGKKRTQAIKQLLRISYPITTVPSGSSSSPEKDENNKNEDNDTVYEDQCCSICLEDYEKGDQLVMLPCRHCFHDGCVVPWLELKSVCCPLCKGAAIHWKSFLPTYDQRAPDHTLTYLSSFMSPPPPTLSSSNEDSNERTQAESSSDSTSTNIEERPHHQTGSENQFANLLEEVQAIPFVYKCIALVIIPLGATFLLYMLMVIIRYTVLR